MSKYAKQRQNLLYYKYLHGLLSSLSFGAKSIIDVGSYDIDMLSFLDCPTKVSLDKASPLVCDGVEAYKMDFFEFEPKWEFDIVCCFQVLEHVPDVQDFAQKLLATGKRILISVPYKWPKGVCLSHVHDPVDEQKLKAWFQKDPIFVDIIDNRIIALFVGGTTTYSDTNKHVESVIADRNEKNSALHDKKVLAKSIQYVHDFNSLKSTTSETLDPDEMYQLLTGENDKTPNEIEILFEKCCEIFPFKFDQYGDPMFLKAYVRYHADNGRIDTALRVMAQFGCTPDDYIWHYIILARAYEKLGEIKKSLSYWKKLSGIEALEALRRLTPS